MNKKYHCTPNGKRWYYHLKKDNDGLLCEMREEEMYSHLLIVNNINNVRYYTSFETFIDYILYIRRVPRLSRCCDEIILEDKYQKLRFDIDAKREEMEDIRGLIDNLIESLIKVFLENNVNIDKERDILICSSNNDIKWSYHIILDNFFCDNCHEAFAWYSKVMNIMDKSYRKFVDSSVYSANHALRILGCTKPEQDRMKIFENKWEYKGEMIEYRYKEKIKNHVHQFNLELEATLITLTDGCLPLPNIAEYKTKVYNNEPLDDIIGEKAIFLLRCKNDNSYRVERKVGNIILLSKKYKFCEICDRDHDNENPYLLLVDRKNREHVYCYDVLLYCRRSEKNKNINLGRIEKYKEDKKTKIVNNYTNNETKGIDDNILMILELSKKDNKNLFI